MTDQRKEKLKGEKALAIAKNIPRKTVFIPRGITGEIFSQKALSNRGINGGKNLDHSEVLKMINEGVKQSVVAKYFKVSSQAISYIKNKYKEN